MDIKTMKPVGVLQCMSSLQNFFFLERHKSITDNAFIYLASNKAQTGLNQIVCTPNDDKYKFGQSP